MPMPRWLFGKRVGDCRTSNQLRVRGETPFPGSQHPKRPLWDHGLGIGSLLQNYVAIWQQVVRREVKSLQRKNLADEGFRGERLDGL
jgi:hypothetical protein